ncbi:hypothetical protein [Pseudorhodobacter sp.]|uniref:hypothetical protein n=1 Tax=Pseudorhodobacter sp. TaxID=1934400 RepID=UPI002AFE9EB1|nr:hypothetical protein [Pseudorhodobacter sp.]
MTGLVACDPGTLSLGEGVPAPRSSVPHVAVSTSAYWVREPLALVGIQRDLGREDEQILGLVNDTTLKGDNFLLMLAGSQGGADLPAFQLKSFVERVGGAPSPFSRVSDSDLRSGSDALGTYFWLEYRSGAQTNCVLAIRRLGLGSRILPARAKSLDVMLRNCVLGPIELALAPILADRIGSSVGGNPSGPRLMSPLAGPTL